MAHLLKKKTDAILLRKKGASVPAIAQSLGIAKSTTWLWVKHVVLSERQVADLVKNSVDGRNTGKQVLAAVRLAHQVVRQKNAKTIVSDLLTVQPDSFWKVFAAILFWCEGGKRHLTSVRFTNSDPELLRVFLYAFRKGFDLDERKFRAVVHIHGYHDDLKQKKFWSEVTGVSMKQFSKSYVKPNTGKRVRQNYQGCLSLRYNDAALARMLDALYHAFAAQIGAW